MDFFVVCRSHGVHLEIVGIVYRSLCAVRSFLRKLSDSMANL